jgi:hypothetical protein
MIESKFNTEYDAATGITWLTPVEVEYDEAGTAWLVIDDEVADD